ncbi:Peptidylprolyl isomerase [Sulfidibacter corallicola]|uniref:Periplasmic chaperone PpiD n=1 Tax=Sulfidibacter corallicola TaxID=2818388 RepID=A0A8A4TU53_SULCO|nr:peptidylprolyl isomerase [Sulfidibacter corallicola]QTD52897.1 peptidylprolyl isomerase [Sulfidibacter corallicola]
MMKFMRKNTTARKVVIAVVVAALASYVLFSFGEAPPVAPGDTIAKVGSSKIKMRDATIQEVNLRGVYRGIKDDQLNQFVVSSLIREAIMLDGANSLDLAVSDAELRDFVINYRKSPNGYVDDENYAAFIRSRYRMPVGSYEDYLRDHALTTDKFRRLFFSSAFVSEEKIKEAFLDQNRKVDLEMVVVNTFDVKDQVSLEGDDLRKFYDEHREEFKTGEQRQVRFAAWDIQELRDSIEVTDEELKTEYEENIERYRTQEQVKANHILIKTGDQGLSDEEALAKIQEIQNEIADGLAFEEAAKRYSEDASNASRGGDLGFFARGRMVKPFEETAFAMADGEVSGPVKTTFGYHLINRVEHRPESVREFETVQNTIRNQMINRKARKQIGDRAAAFREKALTMGFDEAAESLEQKLQTSLYFDNDNQAEMGPTLNRNFTARRAAFQLKSEKDITDVVNLGNTQVVMQWVATRSGDVLAFESNKNRIKAIAEKIAAGKFIEKMYDEIKTAAANKPEATLKDLAAGRDFLKENHFIESKEVDGNRIPFQIRREDLAFEDLFALEPGDFLGSYETQQDSRFALVRLSKKQEADLSKLEEERFQIVENLQSQEAATFLSSYVYGRLTQYDPSDELEAKLLTVMSGPRNR